ncbi:plant expansin [Pisolithus sp. B1]|nr:plant expansin [Pisolithus sp. B1]
MYSAIFSIAVAFSAIAQVNGYVVPRATAPAGWNNSTLEPYDTYHCRYLAIGCQNQHGTSFFSTCCHPLQANETASSLPAECQQPSNTTCSNGEPVTGSASPSATPTGTDDGCVNVGGNPAPTTSSTPAAQSSPASSGSSDSSLNYGGYATYFYQNGNAGACGQVNPDTALICAMDSAIYSQSLCGTQVQITNQNTGQSVTVTVADECPTCDNANSIDLSVGAFETIADLSTGLVPIVWEFI